MTDRNETDTAGIAEDVEDAWRDLESESEAPPPFYLEMIESILERRVLETIYVRRAMDAEEVEKQVEIAAQFKGIETSTTRLQLQHDLLGVEVDARERSER